MMKYYLAIVFGIISTELVAQWTPNGTAIYYNGGNVGIGTNAPSAKLNVYNPGNGTTLLLGNPNSGSGGFTSLSLGTSLDAGGYAWMQSVKNSGSSYGDLIFNASGGNVGIGGSPFASQALSIFRSGDANLGLISTTTNGNSGFWFRNNPTGQDGALIYHPDGRLSINLDKNGAYAENNEYVTVLSNGNVGIGSSGPTSKLTVNGTIHSKEVKVDLSVPGPDYVFEDNYSLQSLEEIDTYIKQNKHLPEVPSAAEMEKEGIKVGEMNMLLLKKMEEMTLYMIELRQENELLKNRVLSLENKSQN